MKIFLILLFTILFASPSAKGESDRELLDALFIGRGPVDETTDDFTIEDPAEDPAEGPTIEETLQGHIIDAILRGPEAEDQCLVDCHSTPEVPHEVTPGSKLAIIPRGRRGIGLFDPSVEHVTELRDCRYIDRKLLQYTEDLAEEKRRWKKRLLGYTMKKLRGMKVRYCLEGENPIIPFTRIVVHHTGTKKGSIRSAYLTGMNGNGDIGYNYLIGPHRGVKRVRIFAGRSSKYSGFAHFQGGANADGLSIALPGNYVYKTPDKRSLDLLESLVRKLVKENPTVKSILSHHQLFPRGGGTKECAGKKLFPHIRRLNSLLKQGEL